MVVEYIVGFIIVGYILLVLVGFIFITYGMFNLASETIPQNEVNSVLTAYVKDKSINATYTSQMQASELANLPTTPRNVPTGTLNMTLSNNEIIIGKITLISMWIFMIIGIMFVIAYNFF